MIFSGFHSTILDCLILAFEQYLNGECTFTSPAILSKITGQVHADQVIQQMQSFSVIDMSRI
jgi:hypothetical protein